MRAANLFRAIAGVWSEEEWVWIRGSEGSKSIQSHTVAGVWTEEEWVSIRGSEGSKSI